MLDSVILFYKSKTKIKSKIHITRFIFEITFQFHLIESNHCFVFYREFRRLFTPISFSFQLLIRLVNDYIIDRAIPTQVS